MTGSVEQAAREIAELGLDDFGLVDESKAAAIIERVCKIAELQESLKWVRDVVGAALDNEGLQEEVDYTLEISRLRGIEG